MIKNNIDRIEGYFLTFTDEEKNLVFDTLYEYGYECDISGLKKWILDSVKETPEEKHDPINNVAVSLGKMIAENPEMIINTGVRIGEGIRQTFKKIRGAI